jgi:hypothetical protein
MINLENTNRVRESAVNVHSTTRVSAVPIPSGLEGSKVGVSPRVFMIFLRHISPGCPLAGTRKDADSEVMQGLADFIINGACPALLTAEFLVTVDGKKIINQSLGISALVT